MKKKRREVESAAVIGIGSRTVGLDILELADGEKPVLLEMLRREVDLGREVFRTGEVPPGEIALLCDIMADCRRKLDEYRVRRVRAVASGALREAANGDLVADRMAQMCGVAPELPDPAERCGRFAAALRRERLVSDSRVAALYADAWASLLLGFEGGVLRFGEELPVGCDRLPGAEARSFAALLRASGTASRLKKSFSGADVSPTLIVAGAGARRIAGLPDGADETRRFAPAEFAAAVKKSKREGDETAAAGGAAKALLEDLAGGEVLVSGLTDRDMTPEKRDMKTFAADLAAVADAVGRRFDTDAALAERRRSAAAALWKKLRARHAMPEHTLPLLEAAATLCDVGNVLFAADRGERSAYIIDALSLPGVSPAERRLVAAATHFARSGLAVPPAGVEKTLPPELRPELFRLAAVLRTAAVLALDPDDDLSGMRLNIAGDELVVTPVRAATGAKRAEFARTGELFLRVFGLTPRIGEAQL